MLLPGNQLLHSLPASELERISPLLQLADMPLQRVLEYPHQPVREVYFPVEGVISIVSQLREQTVEVATVGSEGFVGVPVLLGGGSSPLKAFSQIAGHGYLMNSGDFVNFLSSAPCFSRLLLLSAQSLYHQISQSSACNRTHSIQQRCARWLLMTHDRVAGDRIGLTQEYLGEMLGVRRPQVNRAALALSNAGYIRYSRGQIQILDRPGLEGVACDCYRALREEHGRLANKAAPSGAALLQ